MPTFLNQDDDVLEGSQWPTRVHNTLQRKDSKCFLNANY